MKTAIAWLFSLSLVLGTPARAAEEAAKPAIETPAQRAARMHWWREARFGMFIHWGVYAVPADGEWYMTNHHVPIAAYEKFATKFNPVKFDADRWAQIAHDAGMKYLVITAKHHDGFCMFRTSTTKYNIVDATPWHQDPLDQLSKACKRHGVRFCCYYSIMDWHTPYQTAAKPDDKRPDYNPTRFSNAQQKADYTSYMKAQLKDLVTQYHPGVIWFDGGWIGWNSEDGKDLVAYLHRLDPQLVVNDRANGSGDFGTPEQSIPASGLNRDWETCMTINGNWGFSANDHGFKPTSLLLQNLMDIASKGGNYLLNVGPTDEGVIPAPEVQRLKEMGYWLKTNGNALYGTTAGPFKKQLAWGRATQKPGKLFLTVFDWPKDGSLRAPGKRPGREGLSLVVPERVLGGRKRCQRDSRDSAEEKTRSDRQRPGVGNQGDASYFITGLDRPFRRATRGVGNNFPGKACSSGVQRLRRAAMASQDYDVSEFLLLMRRAVAGCKDAEQEIVEKYGEAIRRGAASPRREAASLVRLGRFRTTCVGIGVPLPPPGWSNSTTPANSSPILPRSPAIKSPAWRGIAPPTGKMAPTAGGSRVKSRRTQ